jgi:hypothetical protein
MAVAEAALNTAEVAYRRRRALDLKIDIAFGSGRDGI